MSPGPGEARPFWFYRLAPDAPRVVIERPPGIETEWWSPGWRALRPDGLTGARWPAWWAMHHLRLFGSREFAILVARDAKGRIVHRAVVFPPFIRFPFMGPEDLQIGDVETVADWRGKGLASWSLATITGSVGAARTCWYLVEPSNEASRRTAERAGFTRHACGHRIPRAGVRALGQFVLDQPIADAR